MCSFRTIGIRNRSLSKKRIGDISRMFSVNNDTFHRILMMTNDGKTNVDDSVYLFDIVFDIISSYMKSF